MRGRRNASRWIIGAVAMLAACSSSTAGSSDSSAPAAGSEPAVAGSDSGGTEAPPQTGAPTSAAPTTEAASTTTASAPSTAAPTAAGAIDGSWLFPYDTLAVGQRRELPYMAGDGRIYVTGSGAPMVSMSGLRGLGWIDVQAAAAPDEGDVAVIANAAGSVEIGDPTAQGGNLSQYPLVDDALLDWFTVRPFVTASERTPVEFGGFVGEVIDYTIGPLEGIGTPCADGPELCASVLTFGPYLRAFREGEQGTLWDLRAGGTHLFAVTLSSEGADLVRSLTYQPEANLFASDSIAFPLLSGGALSAAQTYSIPDMVDGHDVTVTPPSGAFTPHVSPGWIGLYDDANDTSRLAVFRGDRMYWNPAPSTEPVYPLDPSTIASLTPLGDTTLARLADLVGPTATVSDAREVTVSGYHGLRFTLTLVGPGFDCSGDCVAPVVAGFGRSPYVDATEQRTFVVLDVGGSPLLVTANGDAGEALLATVQIRPGA